MLVVWEPILVTDWRAPSGSALGRMSDARARQFWDPKHAIASALMQTAMQLPHDRQPYRSGRFFWDQAIVFGPRGRWESVPSPLFWEGPVYQVMPGLGTALGGKALQTP